MKFARNFVTFVFSTILFGTSLAIAEGCSCRCFTPFMACCDRNDVNAYCSPYWLHPDAPARCQTISTWYAYGMCPQIVRSSDEAKSERSGSDCEHEKLMKKVTELGINELQEIQRSAFHLLRPPFPYSVVMKRSDVLKHSSLDSIALSALVSFTAGSINGEPNGGTVEFGFPVIEDAESLKRWFLKADTDPASLSSKELVGWVDSSRLAEQTLTIYVLPLDRSQILREITLTGKLKVLGNGESREFRVETISASKQREQK